jgi:CDP-diacylglycerol--serine O-phosphatidyltransferase
MLQPKEPQSKSNADGDDGAVVALQQYNDTKGHFSLVRSVWALVLPLIPRADGQPRNFRLADLVTIMNGFCGSFSLFSSANYLITGDEYYLRNALWFPLGGLIFDFFDGKVARWRKSSSMLGQELDSLADLVCTLVV